MAHESPPRPHTPEPHLPELPAAQNLRTIADLERQATAQKALGERLSQRISDFVGSLAFVAAHLVWFTGWASWNALAPEPLRFDPYPYGLLTFIVSLEGVLVATFVLITQNRMNRQAEQRAHLNLQVDLLAEQEMTMVLRLLRQIGERLEVQPLSHEQDRAEQLMRDTNAYDLMEGVKRAIDGDNSGDSAGDPAGDRGRDDGGHATGAAGR